MPREPAFLPKVQLIANDEADDRMQFVQTDNGWELRVYDDAVIRRVTTMSPTLQKLVALYYIAHVGKRSWCHPSFSPHSNWKVIKSRNPKKEAAAAGREPHEGKPQ
eukprot:5273-Heterococcus_DN1.PRE.1